MAGVVVRFGLLALPVLGWGWWTGGRTALLEGEVLTNATLNVSNLTAEGAPPLSFFSFGGGKKGVPPSPSPPPLAGSPSGLAWSLRTLFQRNT